MHVHKTIEAFCDQCSQTLCIECVLTNEHKGHKILSLQTAAETNKLLLINAMNNDVLPLKDQILKWQLQLQSYQQLISIDYLKKEDQVRQNFTELRSIIDQLETQAFDLLQKQFLDLKQLCEKTNNRLEYALTSALDMVEDFSHLTFENWQKTLAQTQEKIGAYNDLTQLRKPLQTDLESLSSRIEKLEMRKVLPDIFYSNLSKQLKK